MSYHVVIPVLVSFALSLVLGPIVIPFLRKLKMGQTEREEGVQSHLKKAGTPTMGGIIILASVVITSLFYVKDYPKVIPILFLTLGFGLIGFLDDYLKVVMKRSDGLYPKQKMALQLVVTAIFAYYVFKVADIPMSMLIYCSDRYCKRNEFYRRTGRTGIQRDGSGSYVLYGGCYWNKERSRADHLCGCRCAPWIFIV